MTQEHNPILNNPYEEPGRHYATRANGSLDYEEIKEGRRIFIPTQEDAPIPKKAGKQKEAFEANDFAERYETELINLIRKEVKLWREDRVKPRNAKDIAYWMVDDQYDGSNFVVRQIFFSGGDGDEFKDIKKNLKRVEKRNSTKKKVEHTLRIEIDDEAFDRLYGLKSHPFEAVKGNKVAVRVVSQFGEEATKVMAI